MLALGHAQPAPALRPEPVAERATPRAPQNWRLVPDATIWEHVSAHVPKDAPGLTPGGLALPDMEDTGAPYVAGAADGTRILNRRVTPNDAVGEEITELMAAAMGSRKPRAYERLYERLCESDPVTYVDRVIERLPAYRLAPERIYDLGRRLVTGGRHRAPVKVGVALFGFFESGYHVEVVLTLARHEEFTYYVVKALGEGLSDAEPVVWKLARQVSGWGRIHAVRQLAETARRPDVLNWLLRRGFRNEIGNEYLALPAAEGGKLIRAMSGHAIDDDLLDAAVDIVRGLLRGGPLGGMDDYADGARVTALVVSQLRSRAATLRDLMALHEIDWFVRSKGNWEARAAKGWTPEVRGSLSEVSAEVLSWPMWAGAVADDLKSEEDEIFLDAAEAAGLLGVDALPALSRRLQSRPFDQDTWYLVMRQLDPARADQVINAAASRLPLGEISAGPVAAMGGALDPAAYVALDVVLAGLVRWPGKGWPLVKAGLASPVIRNRNFALRALDRWGRAAWPTEAEAALRELAAREPEAEVKRRVERLLAGQRLEQVKSTVGGARP